MRLKEESEKAVLKLNNKKKKKKKKNSDHDIQSHHLIANRRGKGVIRFSLLGH